MKKPYFLILILSVLLASCASTPEKTEELNPPENTITLLFAGDIMAHNVNYRMPDYSLIWEGVKDEISSSDLAFGNIESPVDTTQEPQSYPYFNMPEKYVQAAIDAGFNVFSLCNNHTNDQELSGIKETIKTVNTLTAQENEKGNQVYFAGIKDSPESPYTYHLIEKNGWKILFLPMTEILNRPLANKYINYITTSDTKRKEFIEYCKTLREQNPCDLFVLSLHANETEYIRTVSKRQQQFYEDLLNAGVDIIWANHAHIIKDRKVTVDSQTGQAKIVMYANGNTISGQRTKPDLTSANPIEERDNTGDGLFYKVTFTKKAGSETPVYSASKNIFITTYITPERKYVVRKMDEDFINYLNENSQTQWAEYIKKRLVIDETYTKEIIEWK